MLKVWGRRNAFNVQKVLWLLGELQLPHEQVDVGGPFGGLDDPAFLARNPHGRIPVLEDAGKVVWESHAILRYLAACYGAGTFWSDDPFERSDADRWMDWTLATLQRDFMDLFWRYYRTPEAERDMERVRGLAARCAGHYRLLDRHLAGRAWLAGDRLTLADLPAGATLYRWLSLDLDRPAVPNVAAWYGRLAERPAYRKHVMRPFPELKGRLAY